MHDFLFLLRYYNLSSLPILAWANFIKIYCLYPVNKYNAYIDRLMVKIFKLNTNLIDVIYKIYRTYVNLLFRHKVILKIN